MEIRTAESKDYVEIAKLSKYFFPVHNIFQKTSKEVMKYLGSESMKSKLIICTKDDKVLAACFIVTTDKNFDGTHMRWKLMHFCYYHESAAILLLRESEKIIKKSSKTAKIALTIAENEKALIFFKKEGYIQEGELKNHYRHGETSYILGKTFNSKENITR